MIQAVTIKNLSIRFPKQPKQTLNQLTLSIGKGELVFIMGKSGSGKSTLVKCLNGFIPNLYPCEFQGSVEVFGELTNTRDICEISRDIGVVSQNFEQQLFSSSVYLEVAFGPENLRIRPEETRRLVKNALLKTGLAGFEHRNPETLSEGERQRLAIASILSMKPKIIVFDESLTDLDPFGRNEIFSICEMLRMEGACVIFVWNEAREILHADRVILLDEGEIVADEKPKDILRKTALLEKCGIRPYQIPLLFHEMGYTKRLPIDIGEALKMAEEERWVVSGKKYQQLIEHDASHLKNYGDQVVWITGMEHTYPNGIHALNNINLKIREGEFVALAGGNGSGKTTLLNHLNGMLLPTNGDVFVLGWNTMDVDFSQLSHQVGYVSQDHANLLFASSVFEEVAFGPQNLGCSRDEIYRRVYDVLKMVKLEKYEDERPDLLTKGEQQRLALASMFAIKPKIILLDEPVSGLDYQEIKNLMELLVELNQKGHTIIMATQCMWLIAEYSHRMIVMKDGEIIGDDPVREVFSDRNLLREASLLVPEIVEFGYGFGQSFLSAEEFLFCLEKW
ncbi:MAG: ABC transporter ATP-binding protein [bacterium]|nr:ABC transporter ATP-binding protein [bacterium]